MSRGTLDLTFRDGVHGRPTPLVPGQEYDVVVDLDACAYEWTPGNTLRVSVAGSDWPNTVAPPAPVTITTHGGWLELPVLEGDHPAPTFTAGAEHSSESADGVAWEIHDDVLRRVTTARTHTVSDYDTPNGGHAVEDYRGEVSVDRRTFEQKAHAVTVLDLTWPGIAIQADLGHGPDLLHRRRGRRDRTRLSRDGAEVSHRTWRETIPHPWSQ